MIYRLTDERIITLLRLLRQVAETNLAEMERLVSQLFADDAAAGALEAVSRDELLDGLERGEVALLADCRFGHARVSPSLSPCYRYRAKIQ